MPVYKISASADFTVPPNVRFSGAVNNRGVATRVGTSSANLGNVTVSRSQFNIGSVVLDTEDTDPALNGTVIAFRNQRPIAKRLTSSLAGQANTFMLSGADVPGQNRSIAKREAYKVSKTSTATRNGNWDAYAGKYLTHGIYTRTAFAVTVTAPNHGLATNDFVKLDFTSGGVTDGRFQVSVVNPSSFTVTHGTSGTANGSLIINGPAFAVESVNSDTAANPTRAVPGHLTFKTGAKLPVTTNDYKSRSIG